jgi:predicted DNA-binding WGR domain protein
MNCFFISDSESPHRFLRVQTGGNVLCVTGGEVEDFAEGKDDSLVFVSLGSNGATTRTTLPDAAICEQEAAALVSQKRKSGYREVDPLYLPLYDGVRLLRNHYLSKESHTLTDALEELDQREQPVPVWYRLSEWNVSLYTVFRHYAAYHRPGSSQEPDFEKITALVYRLPKLRPTDDEGASVLNSVAAYGLITALCTENKDLEDFCRDYLPSSPAGAEHFLALAALSASRGDAAVAQQNAQRAVALKPGLAQLLRLGIFTL